MDKLLNKIITKVELSDTTQTLVFTDGNGDKYIYETYGDCCSSSWFAHITGLKNLLGQKINVVKDRVEDFTSKDYEKAEKEYRRTHRYSPESLTLYGIMLKTDKGTCDIEFRNESNGYYGGSCEFKGMNLDRDNLKEIKKDF